MTDIQCYNIDNMKYETDKNFNLIYCDYLYQNTDFSWVDKYWQFLNDTGIFIVQTDDSTQAEIKSKLINEIGYKDYYTLIHYGFFDK